ncbi:TRAP transporter small permease [Mesorhizobium sp. A556]
MDFIDKTLSAASRALMWLAAALILAMMVHVMADVLMRALINKPVPGTAEIVARYYMVAAVFLPLPLVEIRNSGISVDLFYLRFSEPIRRAAMFIAYVGQTAFFGFLAFRSFEDALSAFWKGDYIDGQIIVVVWPAAFLLPAGFGLAALVSVLRTVQTLTRGDWAELTAQHPNTIEAEVAREGV